jgi:hypothetical protein
MGGLGRVGRVAVTLGLGAALLLAGCGDDDGAGVRGGGSASASGSGTGSGTGSGSGLAYANADGTFDPYTALAAADKTRMQAELADLSEKLARIPGVLGLKA